MRCSSSARPAIQIEKWREGEKKQNEKAERKSRTKKQNEKAERKSRTKKQNHGSTRTTAGLARIEPWGNCEWRAGTRAREQFPRE
jgi:hypothetical protein